MKSSLLLVGQKEITGSSRVSPLKKLSLQSTSSYQPLNIRQSKSQLSGLKSQGFEVDFAPVDNKGFVDVEALADLIRPDTTLVSVMAVNNEIGSIQPIEAISELLAE